MKKLGFLDYYLDEWHANHYVDWLRDASQGEVQAVYAYGQINSPHPGGKTTEEWCAGYGLQKADTIEELIEKSDALLVLAPMDPWKHEELCQLPMRSGKPCYVDKTFAPDYPTAKRIFDIAQRHGTPCWSSSALRFAEEYREAESSELKGLCSWGPNNFEDYAIHQLEPIMMLMGAEASEVMYLPGDRIYHGLIRFCDGRVATMSGFENGSPFTMNLSFTGESRVLQIESDFFACFIKALADFFQTGTVPVSQEETLKIIAVRGALLEAMKTPGEWRKVEAP